MIAGRLWLASVALGLVAMACSGGGPPVSNRDAGLDATGDGSMGTNACGGTRALAFDGGTAGPDAPCGPCGDGRLICASPSVLACVGAHPARFCADAGALDATTTDATTPGDASDAGPIDAVAEPADSMPPAADAMPPPYDAATGWQPFDASVPIDTVTDGGVPAEQCLELPAADLVVAPGQTVAYASIGDQSPFGNSVVRIDLPTLTVTGTVFVGSKPNALAISDDGTSLYVGDDGTLTIRRIDVTTGAVGAPLYLVDLPDSGGPQATAILAVPGSSTQYVANLYPINGYPASAEQLILVDNGSVLAAQPGDFGPITFLNATTLVAYSSTRLMPLSISAAGVQQEGAWTPTYDPRPEIIAQGGWVFAWSGEAFDGTTGQSLGRYPASGYVWPDLNGTDVWMLGQSLDDFDRASFQLKNSYPIPSGAWTSAYNWTSFEMWAPGTFVFNWQDTKICVIAI